MILVTGAGGKTGRAVIDALHAAGQPVRAWVRRPEQARSLPVAEAVAGDLEDARLWREACRGAQAVYFICPNMHPREEAIGRLALDASREAAVERFVYHSVLHPQTQDMPHHWQKLRVEEEIFRSRLPYVILQPCAYMQNVLAYRDPILSAGRYAVPYNLHSRFALVDLGDVARVAARVLSQAGHAGAIYELAGAANLSSHDIAAELGRQLQRPVGAARLPLEAWERGARGAGMPSTTVEALAAMFRYYDRYGLVGNGNVLGWLLGSRPTTFSRFVTQEFDA